jgi:hypothetical protein
MRIFMSLFYISGVPEAQVTVIALEPWMDETCSVK